jgi:hypothetical protein
VSESRLVTFGVRTPKRERKPRRVLTEAEKAAAAKIAWDKWRQSPKGIAYQAIKNERRRKKRAQGREG